MKDKTEKICAYCEYATPLFDGDTALCQKKGVVPKNHTCRKFSFDPLKHRPPQTNKAPELEYIDIEDGIL